MVVPLNIKLSRSRGVRKFIETNGRKRFNSIVRDEMQKVGQWWLDERLKLRLMPGAASRFKFRRRSSKWLAHKRRLKESGLKAVRLSVREIVIVKMPGQKTEPYYYTDSLAEKVLGEAHTARATATQHKINVKSPIPLGHPINTLDAGVLPELLQSEHTQMSREVHPAILRRIEAA